MTDTEADDSKASKQMMLKIKKVGLGSCLQQLQQHCGSTSVFLWMILANRMSFNAMSFHFGSWIKYQLHQQSKHRRCR